jgi:RimJ/RimL family protein N-acetyltransferase
VNTIKSGRISIGVCDETSKAELVAMLSDPQVFELYFASARRADMQAKVGEWAGQADAGLFAVRDRASGHAIGCIELVAGHLSYFVAPARWGQGYGSEMVAAFLAQLPALRALDAVYTTVARENMASRRILEKSGFDFAGIFSARRAGAGPAHALLEYVCRFPARLAHIEV